MIRFLKAARLSVVLFSGSVCLAGPITPPAGPVSSTPKTLAEVEPRIAINATNTPGDSDSLFKISSSGSYYLTGNIAGVAAKHGIEITANGVTLDLMGFELLGVAGSLDGVTVSTSRGLNITIRNGSVRRWGDCGIEFNNNSGNPPGSCTVSDIHASDNGRDGIATQSQTIVTRCTASENLADGISTIAGCTVSDCATYNNGDDGVSTNTGCTVTGSTAESNTGTGFSVALGSTISGCTASNNGIGITAQGSTIQDCVAYSNLGNGIGQFEGNTISRCAAYRNAGHGIVGGRGSIITDCAALTNELDGIRVSSDCIVRSNTCSTNGDGAGDGAGIHATSSDNLIQGNNCAGSDRGIEVDLSGNIIIANTCSGNATNWDVAANNKCLVILGVNAGAILGDSGGASPGSTNPWANYTY